MNAGVLADVVSVLKLALCMLGFELSKKCSHIRHPVFFFHCRAAVSPESVPHPLDVDKSSSETPRVTLSEMVENGFLESSWGQFRACGRKWSKMASWRVHGVSLGCVVGHG